MLLSQVSRPRAWRRMRAIEAQSQVAILQARHAITGVIHIGRNRPAGRVYDSLSAVGRFLRTTVIVLTLSQSMMFADEPPQVSVASSENRQINVNWLYGSYVPKDVPLESMSGKTRFNLYIRQTYTTWGIYVKTFFFATQDQAHGTFPEWGNGFEGYMKRFGSRQAQFIVQNSTISLGDGLLGWEPRYDRCRCNGFWPRTGHALARNFVTYARTEKSLRPQLLPYIGAFAGSVTATAWEPGNPNWQIKGYQAVVTQVPVGMGIYWIGEFAPEIFRVFKKHKKSGVADSQAGTLKSLPKAGGTTLDPDRLER
jgi:hypothetical protein